MVCPNNEREDRDRCSRIHHRCITEQLFTGEGWDDCRHYSKRRQNHDVYLGVTEEPENMLIKNRVTANRCVKEACAEVTVCQDHCDRSRQDRHHSNEQISGDQPCPAKQRHLHQGHARRAHVQNRHNDVNRAHNGRGAHEVHGKNRHVHSWTHLRGQWRIKCPAGCRCTAWHKKRTRQQDTRHWQEPETEVVHAREGHVRCTNLQRNHPVREANKGGHDGAKHHNQAMHGRELVEQLRAEEL